MNNQTLSLIRTILKIVGSALATHGLQKEAEWLNSEDIAGAVILLVGIILSMKHHAGAPEGPVDVKKVSAIAILLTFIFAIGSGCSSTNITKLTQALSRDPAIVSAKVATVYGTASLVRVGSTTNTVTVGPDGTVTVGK